MALNANDVIAATEQPAPPEAPEEAAPAQDGQDQQFTSIDPAAALENLPEEVIKMPWIFDLAKGKPAAVSDVVKSKDPDYKTVIKYAQPLVAAGFGLYKSIDHKRAVIFNLARLGADQLYQADHEGKLDELAPPLDQVRKAAQANRPQHPNDATPEGAAGAPPAGPAPVPESQPAPSVQTNLATKRAANLAPGGPTSGPSPGSGRILNSILKSAV